MKVVCVIQARLGSTRFPRKVLQDIGGKPMIAHVVERVRAVPGISHVVVAVGKESDASEMLKAAPCAVSSFDWIDEADVLRRYVEASERYDVVMRVTADCPLWAPDIAEDVLLAHVGEYTSNLAHGYVDGTDVEVISRAALQRACAWTRDPHDKEHVTPWLKRHCVHTVIPPDGDYSRHKWSVDTPEDLDRVRQIMQRARGLTFADTLAASAEAGV